MGPGPENHSAPDCCGGEERLLPPSAVTGVVAVVAQQQNVVLWNDEGASRVCWDRDIGLDKGTRLTTDAAVVVDDDQISGRFNDSLDNHLAEFRRSDENDVSAGDHFCPVNTSGEQPLARFQRRRHRTGSDPRHEGNVTATKRSRLDPQSVFAPAAATSFSCLASSVWKNFSVVAGSLPMTVTPCDAKSSFIFCVARTALVSA
jgi:hypothetical protein